MADMAWPVCTWSLRVEVCNVVPCERASAALALLLLQPEMRRLRCTCVWASSRGSDMTSGVMLCGSTVWLSRPSFVHVNVHGVKSISLLVFSVLRAFGVTQ